MADSIMSLEIAIRAVDYFTGPLRSMISQVSAADTKMKGIASAMKLMGKSAAEIDAVNASLQRMADQKAFANVAQDLQSIGMARQDIAAMEQSYMRMAQRQRDIAAAQATYTEGKDLAMSGAMTAGAGVAGFIGLFDLVKKAGEFQSNMTVIQDSTGASAKQMQAFGDAVMNTSAQVSKFNDMDVAKIAQTLTSGGFSNIKQAQSLLLPVAKYAEVQMYEHKSSDAITSTQQAIEMAHVFKNYDPKSFGNFLNDFNKYSMMQPGDSSSLVQTLTYLAPKAQTLGMGQSDILALSAVANRVGLTGSHGGTNSADLLLRLIPGIVGGKPTAKGTPKAWKAMEELGFVDKNGNSPFFDKNGKIVNLNAMLTTMINDGKKLNPKQLTQAYHDIFGAQGGNAASILANKTTLEQLTQMRTQLSKTKGMEQINKDLQATPEGQLNLLKSNGMTLMLRVGQQLAITLNPAIAAINKMLGSMLKFSQAHPGVAKIIGDFALLATTMVTVTGLFNIFKGSFLMLQGAFKMLKLGSLVETIGFGPLIAGIAAVAAAAFLIYKNWGTIGPFVKKLWNDIKTATLNTWNSVKPTIMNAVNTVWSTMKSAWGGIVSFVKSIWPQVLQITRTVWPIVSQIVSTTMKNIWVEIQTVGTIIGATFKAIWTVLVPIVKAGWDLISNIIKVGLDLLTGNWKKAWTDFKKLLSSAWKDIGNIFKSLATSAFQWGRDVISGLINGVKSMVGNIGSAISNIAGSVSSSFKKALGINSPSKVFMAHGASIIEGLTKGIDRNAHLANKSTANLAKGVNGSFGNGLSLAGGNGNIEIHIHPHPNQRAEDIADMVMKKLGKSSRRMMMNAGTTVNMGAM